MSVRGAFKASVRMAAVAVIGSLLAAVPQTNARAASCSLVTELIAFVSDETDYPRLTVCPPVQVTTTAVLRSMFAIASAHGEEPLAAFLPGSGRILLSPEIDLTAALGRSYLVHEIVHAAQAASRKPDSVSCPGLLESEAYWVQARYLREHELNETARVFELMSIISGACPQPY